MVSVKTNNEKASLSTKGTKSKTFEHNFKTQKGHEQTKSTNTWRGLGPFNNISFQLTQHYQKTSKTKTKTM